MGLRALLVGGRPSPFWSLGEEFLGRTVPVTVAERGLGREVADEEEAGLLLLSSAMIRRQERKRGE